MNSAHGEIWRWMWNNSLQEAITYAEIEKEKSKPVYMDMEDAVVPLQLVLLDVFLLARTHSDSNSWKEPISRRAQL